MLKAKRHKLLLALSLLIISAVLMSTASYAWFAMNTRATADNFEVEAYSDSLYLEISKEQNANYNQTISYGESDRKDLRLVTYKIIGSADQVFKAPTFTQVTEGNYASGTYYAKADSDVATGVYNYVAVTLHPGTSLAGLYTGIGFGVLLNGTAAAGEIYYTSDAYGNDFTAVTCQGGEALKGMYALYQPVTGTYAEGTTYYTKAVTGQFVEEATATAGEDVADGTYVRVTDGEPTALTAGTYTTADVTAQTIYWAKDDNGNFSVQEHLSVGDELAGYYTATTETLADTTFDGTSVYYVQSGDDYVCLGTPAAGTAINGYLYWGRAYSTELNEVQANNTLNVLSESVAEADYYLHKTLYLRQGENTNHATNLRVSDIKVSGAASSLKDALRVLIIATSTSGETATATYDAGTDVITHENGNNNLFAMLLGDQQETVTVEVYIYFDGTDDVAKNDSIAVLNGQIVSIEFAIDELEYNKVQ